MLLPERMYEVQLLTRREDTERVIAYLADAKAIHLQDHEKEHVLNTEVDIGSPLATAEELSDTLTKTRTLLSKLQPSKEPTQDVPVEDRIARIQTIADKYIEHEQHLVACEQKMQALHKQQELLAHPLPSPLQAIWTAKSVRTILVQASQPVEVDALTTEQAGTVTCYVVLAEKEEETLALLKAAGATIIDLEPLRGLTGTKEEAQQRLKEQLTIAHHDRHHERQRELTFNKHWAFLTESEPILAVELLKAQAPLHFGATKRATLIKGFVPVKAMGQLEEQLAPLVVMERKEAVEAPTKLNNKIKSFEELIKLYTLPKYNEIDPTNVLVIAFPIMFGFMLGDIGYGITLFALFAYLGHKIKSIKPFAKIIMLSAVSTIAFGFMYGEIFGMEELFGHHLPYLIHRIHELPLMFGIAIGIGLLHINIGLLFGIINEARKDGIFFALISKGSWMLLQAGIALVVFAHDIVPGYTFDKLIAYGVLSLAIAGIIYAEGLRGVFELPTIMSHTLSYTRLVAVGLASVYLALVVNQMGADLFAKGGAWLALGFFVIVAGHAINLALGLLGPFLHSLRLHYAEFFMKFYEGGGTAYVPFGEVMYGIREH
ncbi:MAG: V-type ATP synthase subunit I [Candidatus Woesearchaeota archaeon]|nr:V-type ATP synthase subunit I [Candidatus Woesearchaeota archaeon]